MGILKLVVGIWYGCRNLVEFSSMIPQFGHPPPACVCVDRAADNTKLDEDLAKKRAERLAARERQRFVPFVGKKDKNKN